MNEPTIICPNCKTEIKLNESLAAPLIEATKRDYEQRIANKENRQDEGIFTMAGFGLSTSCSSCQSCLFYSLPCISVCFRG